MHWIYLIFAIIFEVGGTSCMKLSNGFTKPLPSILMGIFYPLCFICLTVAIKKIDVSVAYAVWSGVGIALISAIAFIIFREPITNLRLAGLIAVTVGIVLLCLSEKHSPPPADSGAKVQNQAAAEKI